MASIKNNMRSIFSVIGIILAGSIFFLYTKPTYDDIQAIQVQIAQYNDALAKATQLQTIKATLLDKYNHFTPTDLARLQVLLPDQVNNIGLILDLDTLASQFGISLENVDISSGSDTSEKTTVNATPRSVVDTGPSNANTSKTTSRIPHGGVTQVGTPAQQYKSLDVKFTVHSTYSTFIQFITALQNSLRIVDLVSISVSAGGGASGVATSSNVGGDSIMYTFAITLRTYWLK